MTRSRTIRLPVELDERIAARAARSNRTVSNQIVSLLIHAMAELEQQPPPRR